MVVCTYTRAPWRSLRAGHLPESLTIPGQLPISSHKRASWKSLQALNARLAHLFATRCVKLPLSLSLSLCLSTLNLSLTHSLEFFLFSFLSFFLQSFRAPIFRHVDEANHPLIRFRGDYSRLMSDEEGWRSGLVCRSRVMRRLSVPTTRGIKVPFTPVLRPAMCVTLAPVWFWLFNGTIMAGRSKSRASHRENLVSRRLFRLLIK